MFMPNLIFSNISNFIWSYFFLPALFVCAILLSIGCRGIQFKKFGYAMKHTVGKSILRSDASNKGVSSFQAAATALGSTVGTGNIVGTAQAICLGGPGALFWLWTAALISMIVKYAEICLAIYFRKTVPGYGPMDYIRQGLHSKKLALFYGVMALLSSLSMGNISQVSSITDSFLAMINAFSYGPDICRISARLSIGLAIAALTLILLTGGTKRITKWAELLVPFMLVLFICVSLTVIGCNINKLPDVIKTVFIEAFSPGSICAGISGVSTAKCIQWGFRRSAFSNEAGLGTSAIAHASAETVKAAEQGLWGIFEVFADTIIICSCTSLCILCSGIDIPWGSITGTNLYLYSLETVFGEKISAFLLTLFMGLFAYTSIMAWALYGSRCTEYIFGEKICGFYRFTFIVLLVIGSVLPTSYVWEIADFINAIMSIPNLIALIILSPIVFSISKNSFS